MSSTSLPKSGARNEDSASKTSINQLKSSKQTRNRIPPPQRVRVIQKYIAGKNISEIAREENRNRETVARIVKGDEVGKVVQQTKAEYYGLIHDAVAAVRHALQQQKDARIGYRILADTGVIPSPGEAQINAMQAEVPDPGELTSLERATAQDDSGRINPALLGAVRMGVAKDAIFGLKTETADEIWRNRTVNALVDEMTDGENWNLSMSNSMESKRLKGLAEDVLQGKRAMTDQEILAVRKEYRQEGR